MSMYCSECGNQMPDQAKFCPKCGSPVTQGQIQNPNTSYQPQPQPQPQPAPKAKANSGSVMKKINAVLLLAVLALIIVGAITIPGNLKKLPPVGFADVQPDAEVDADYETLASGGTLLGEAPDDDWAAYVTHETPEWYYADEDE